MLIRGIRRLFYLGSILSLLACKKPYPIQTTQPQQLPRLPTTAEIRPTPLLLESEYAEGSIDIKGLGTVSYRLTIEPPSPPYDPSQYYRGVVMKKNPGEEWTEYIVFLAEDVDGDGVDTGLVLSKLIVEYEGIGEIERPGCGISTNGDRITIQKSPDKSSDLPSESF